MRSLRKQLDDETGLYYYGARYYNPLIGRFITPDTIVQNPFDPQSLNRYTYCRNNPVNLVDPTGQSWKSFWRSVGDFFSNLGKSFVQNPGIFIAGLVGGIAFGMLGSAFVSSFMLPSMSVGGITVLEGALMTAVEFGIGGFGAGLASGLASGQSFTSALTNAGYGFAGGFVVGGIVGATYAAGWQDWIHGVDSQKINNLHTQAESALKSGDLQTYVKASSELIKMNATPPSGVLVGYSKITGPLDHTYLIGIEKGQITARGFNPKEFNVDVLLNKKVPGMVTNDKYLIPTSRFSNALTTDINTVRVVVENMKTIKLDYYQMLNMKSNCYGWRDTVLEASNLEPPTDGVFRWNH